MAHGDHHTGDVKSENDGRRTSHEVQVGQLVLEWVERRGGDAEQNLIGRWLRNRNANRFQRQPSSVSCVTDTKKRLRNVLSPVHDTRLQAFEFDETCCLAHDSVSAAGTGASRCASSAASLRSNSIPTTVI